MVVPTKRFYKTLLILVSFSLLNISCSILQSSDSDTKKTSPLQDPKDSPRKQPPPPKVGLYFEDGVFKLYGEEFISIKPSDRELRDFETLVDCLRVSLGPTGPTTEPSGNKQEEGYKVVDGSKVMKPFFRLNYPTFNENSQIPKSVNIIYIVPGEIISELGLPNTNVGIIEYGHMDGRFFPLNFYGVIGFEELKKEVRSMTTIQKTPIKLQPLQVSHPDKMPCHFNFAVYILDVCYPGRLHSPPYRNMKMKK